MSYANLSDMLQERGISVNRSTIYRWFIEFAPSLRKKVRRYQMINADSSWQLENKNPVLNPHRKQTNRRIHHVSGV